ncbi:MAG TPA: 6-carboxytetrahydropterin synthase QueD [Leptospiraceae bacterium]|nr:6-carboxytetrahydropterin synthase QueD [Leptospirales bacterium]HMU81795.1 6-carboxytetrahydropterin synthase QueD [Leptospiraceae bacterium]HMW58737.1 6-carboxytetrahydropterin synthase QueD [Leptospiraceae bacterium]HMX55370.1 6-carboxytetrahydropterin synthase QueD [Leptospiraceae bacterium]HMY46257.1 6-carboxytetrahydropterin synthase QueD [Leptospiraceae bacterium]
MQQEFDSLHKPAESRVVEIVKQFRFEAAHFLPRVPEGHKCGRMHGHSFRFEIKLNGEVNPQTGWLMDFGDITSVVKPLLEKYLDHNLLNEVPGLENPTSEEVAIWLWKRLKPSMPFLTEIIVHETCNARCIYKG